MSGSVSRERSLLRPPRVAVLSPSLLLSSYLSTFDMLWIMFSGSFINLPLKFLWNINEIMLKKKKNVPTILQHFNASLKSLAMLILKNLLHLSRSQKINHNKMFVIVTSGEVNYTMLFYTGFTYSKDGVLRSHY